MQELSVDDLIELHQLGISLHGGASDVPATAPGAMSGVLFTATYNGGLLGYAGGILCYLARAQHFVDSNKRVAWLGCVRALEINGYYLKVETDDAIEFVKRIVLEKLDVSEVAEQLAEWLEVLE